jgi:hypothetical protein
MSSSRRYELALVLALLLGEELGCDARDRQSALQQVGITDPPTPSPERVDFACDLSEGSPCSDETARRNLSAVVRYLWPRVGSRLVVWSLGEEVGETRPLATVDVPQRVQRAARADREAESRFLDSVIQAVCPVIAARARRGRPHRSPIAASITRIASESPRGMSRRIVLLSDAREVSSLGNWECRDLPAPREFAQKLRRHALLREGSLDGAHIHFLHATPEPGVGTRCPFTMEREESIRELWRQSLREAGAADVSFDLGGFELTTTDHTRP